MSKDRLKKLALLIAGCTLGATILLLVDAKPLSPAPGAPLGSPEAPPAPALGAAPSSTHPEITWSTTSTEVILSPGESTSQDFTLTPSLALQNIVLEAVPEIAGFLTIRPSAFANIAADQLQSVHISYSIPSGTALGTYYGTVHVRAGNTTYPQTLKVVVGVWQGAQMESGKIIIDVPPGWSVQTTASELDVSTPILQSLTTAQDAEVPPEDFVVRILPNPATLSINDFASQFDQGWFGSYATKTLTMVDGHEAVIYSDADAVVPHQPRLSAFIDDPNNNQVILMTMYQLNSASIQDVFMQLVSAVQFH